MAETKKMARSGGMSVIGWNTSFNHNHSDNYYTYKFDDFPFIITYNYIITRWSQNN